MTTLPTGTVTFLMTDIEGSTRLTASASAIFAGLLDQHFDILDRAVASNAGTVVSSEGDALFAVFVSAREALAAAIDGQRGLANHEWPVEAPIKVRMGIHTGEAVFGGRDYTGLEVHRTARIAAAAWGGEILVSDATQALAADNLPAGATLRDLGRHELRDLPAPERLFQLCAPGLQLDFPPPRARTVATPTNLPRPMTRFIGRQRELAEVLELLTVERLVTLIGPGGTGKTRLAIEAARGATESYPDGVWFVALDAVRDPVLVAPTIAGTLGLPERPGLPATDVLIEHLADLRVLILLDNLEQVVQAAPDVARLLGGTTQLTLLGSSREPLSIGGERVYPVPTLGLPGEPGLPKAADLAAVESVQLFVERARGARPSFGLTDENAPAVAAICRRLDGLPLALELAAARLNTLAPAQILERLDHRLNIAASVRRDLPERQRTLRGAIDWSHDLLDPAGQAVFRRLSVFVGGADVDAVLAVADAGQDLGADPLDVLGALVDRSLVRSDHESASVRFVMLETIREFAAEKLAESDEEATIRRLHATHYGSLAAASAKVLTDPNRDSILDRLDLEVGNLRAALAWTIESGDFGLGHQLAGGLKDFWRTRNHLTEARTTINSLLLASAGEPPSSERAATLGVATELAAWHADYAAAHRLSDQWIAMLETLGDKPGLGMALSGLGWANLGPQPAAARDAFEKSVAILRDAPPGSGLIGALQGLSLAFVRVDDLERGREVADEAIRVALDEGDLYTNSFNYLTRGVIDMRRGMLVEAGRWMAEALRAALSASGSIGVMATIDGIAALALDNGDADGCIKLGAYAEKLRLELGGGPSTELVGLARPLERARAEVDAARFDAAAAAGRALTSEEAIALSLAVAESGPS